MNAGPGTGNEVITGEKKSQTSYLFAGPPVLRLRLEPRVVRLALVLLRPAVAGLAPRPLRAEELRVAPQLAHGAAVLLAHLALELLELKIYSG